MELNAWGQTDIGCHRKSNQDRFLIDQKHLLYILADGMGGHHGGDVAAEIAVNTVREVTIKYYNEAKGVDYKILMTDIFNAASRKVYEKSKEKKELSRMGTTLVVALYRDEKLYIGHVGDSRAYLISKTTCGKTGMWQMTEDHSLINQQIQAGLITPKDKNLHIHKNVLTRSIGFQDQVNCDVVVKKIKKNDNILICSDGLTNMVSDEDIYQTYLQQPQEQLVPKLIKMAKDAGGLDNITIVLLNAKETEDI